MSWSKNPKIIQIMPAEHGWRVYWADDGTVRPIIGWALVEHPERQDLQIESSREVEAIVGWKDGFELVSECSDPISAYIAPGEEVP